MIRKYGNRFTVTCDYDGCLHTDELKATTFQGAVAEAKKLGYKLKRSKDGSSWVNFCTEFCEMCYDAPVIWITKPKN